MMKQKRSRASLAAFHRCVRDPIKLLSLQPYLSTGRQEAKYNVLFILYYTVLY